MRYRLVLLFVFQIITYECDAFRILALFPLPIKSHNIFFEKFMKELASRGHEVHVLSHFPQKYPIANYHDIAINGSLSDEVSHISVQHWLNRGPLGKTRYILKTCGTEICDNILQHPSVINLKNSVLKFDLVISEVYGTDCLLIFAHLFQAPVIGISGTDLLPWASSRMGNTENPSHIPSYFLATSDRMPLYEKLAVLAAFFLTKIGYFLASVVTAEVRVKEFYREDFPSLEAIISNTSLLLVNSHFSINTPRPMVPGIIEVGGLHIENPKPLTTKLEQIVKSSKEGIIYFSLGTVIDLNTMNKEIRETIINAFGKMPQTIILSGTIANTTIPKNVIVLPWVEQLDLLCHPELKVFITHGGLMSMQEAAYCGVPILGISIFPDHDRNLIKYVNNGGGLYIGYDYLTEEDIVNSLNNLMKNATYKTNAQRISKIFRERPMSPLDAAVYWTEYIAKFEGARHLRTKSADMTWFEYYLVDCLIILAIMGAVGLLIAAAAIHFIQNYIDDEWFNGMNVIAKKEKDTSPAQIEKESDKDK